MKFYLNSQAALMGLDNKKLATLNPNTIVIMDDDSSIVTYNGLRGKIEGKYLEPYGEMYPKDCVDVSDIETPDPNDAAQYVLWEKYKQTNMCGELCACYVVGKKENRKVKLSELLENWKVKDLPFYKRVFSSPKARGTYPAELVGMYKVLGYNAKELSKELLPLGRYTPFHLNRLNYPIVSVKIDANTGRLRGQGVGHWVVVVTNLMERTGYGFVNIYNPFSNREEVYSWNEFISSAGSYPYGALALEML